MTPEETVAEKKAETKPETTRDKDTNHSDGSTKWKKSKKGVKVSLATLQQGGLSTVLARHAVLSKKDRLSWRHLPASSSLALADLFTAAVEEQEQELDQDRRARAQSESIPPLGGAAHSTPPRTAGAHHTRRTGSSGKAEVEGGGEGGEQTPHRTRQGGKEEKEEKMHTRSLSWTAGSEHGVRTTRVHGPSGSRRSGQSQNDKSNKQLSLTLFPPLGSSPSSDSPRHKELPSLSHLSPHAASASAEGISPDNSNSSSPARQDLALSAFLLPALPKHKTPRSEDNGKEKETNGKQDGCQEGSTSAWLSLTQPDAVSLRSLIDKANAKEEHQREARRKAGLQGAVMADPPLVNQWRSFKQQQQDQEDVGEKKRSLMLTDIQSLQFLADEAEAEKKERRKRAQEERRQRAIMRHMRQMGGGGRSYQQEHEQQKGQGMAGGGKWRNRNKQENRRTKRSDNGARREHVDEKVGVGDKGKEGRQREERQKSGLQERSGQAAQEQQSQQQQLERDGQDQQRSQEQDQGMQAKGDGRGGRGAIRGRRVERGKRGGSGMRGVGRRREQKERGGKEKVRGIGEEMRERSGRRGSRPGRGRGRGHTIPAAVVIDPPPSVLSLPLTLVETIY
eukprot:gb/GEZN01002015.1/.p1 GENE.gb/GEZN01002015.1/~~gb/GEZN01002015.1/.p1  ORF type:complete len:681 (+),score=253.18 gb/GEZN01002015.1/:184-2043(+)